jgi:hypothetical protein
LIDNAARVRVHDVPMMSTPPSRPATREGELSARAAVAVPILLLFLPLFVPMLMNRVFAHTDIGVFHLPLRRIFAAALRDGDSFTWTSQMFNGFYVHAEGQLGAFHPLHLLLYRFMPLTIAFNLELIASYIFIFIGSWLFLRHIGFSTLSIGVGAIAFAFSGFQLLHLGHPNAVAITAHIPWLLLAIDAALSQDANSRAKGAASVALLTASQVLLGYPQYVWLSAFTCAIYAIVVRPSWLALWLPAAAAVAGLCAGGVQLLPTADLLAHSDRSMPSQQFRLTFSLHPLNLVQLLSPYALPSRVHATPKELYVHEFGVYNGALCTVAVVWALLRRGQLPFQRLTRFAGISCAIGAIFALGKYGYVYAGVAMLPILGAFRAPARHLLLVHLGLALLAAVMMEDLVRSARDRVALQRIRSQIAIPLALSAATAAIALTWWVVARSSSTPPIYPASVLIGTGIMAVVTVLVRDAAKGVQAALFVIPTFLALDLGVWGYSYAWGSPPQSVGEIAALAPEPPGRTPPRSVHDADERPTINYWLLRDARVARPYVGLAPRFTLPLGDQALRVAGVEWVRGSTGWRQVENPMGRLRVVPFTRLSQDPAADLDSTQIEDTALVDRPIDAPLARPTEASVSLVSDRPGRVEIDVDAQRRALLALTESYYPGWTAQSGGAEAITLPLYGDYLGVLAPPGRYRLTLRFDPPSLRYGRYLSYAGVLATALLFVVVKRRPIQSGDLGGDRR